MPPYVASTLATDVDYAIYEKRSSPGGAHKIMRSIRIKGGAGVANRKHALAEGVLTPNGVVTAISDEDLAILKKDEVFQLHEKNGHVKVMNSNTAPDKAAKDMNKKDPSAPFTPQDYEKDGRAQKMAVPGADALKAPAVEEAEVAAVKKGKKS